MFYRWLGAALLKRRWPILGLLLLMTIGSGLMLPSIGFDFRPQAMLEFSDEEEQFASDFESRFGSNDNMLLVILDSPSGDSLLTPEGLTTIELLTKHLATYEDVEGTYSLTAVPRREVGTGLKSLFTHAAPKPLIDGLPVTEADARRVGNAVEDSGLLSGSLIARDGSAAMVVVSIFPKSVDPIRLAPVIEQMETGCQEIVSDSSLRGVELHLGGLPFVRTETVRQMKTEQLLLWPAVGAIYFILLLGIFRRVTSALLPLIAVGAATLWSVGWMGVVGQPINMINNTLPTLILVVGVCNAIHVMLRIEDHRKRGASPSEAIVAGVSDIGLPSFLTTTTTAIGFASLVVAHSKILQTFGWLVAFGIMLTYVAIIVLLPILVSFWQPRSVLAKASEPEGTRSTWLSLKVERATRVLIRNPFTVLFLTIGAAGVALWVGLGVPVDARVMDAFQEGDKVYESNRLIEDKLGGILPLEVDLKAEAGAFSKAENLERVRAFQDDIEGLDGVLSTLSVVDLMNEAGFPPDSEAQAAAGLSLLRGVQGEVLERFVSTDLSNTHVTVRLPDNGNRKTLKIIAAIDKFAQKHFGSGSTPIAHRMTGVAYLSAIGLDTFVRDLLYSLLTASIVIFVILILVFRSWVVGLIALLPNFVPLVGTLGVMPLFGYELNTTTVVVFTIAIGLAVDNSIHLLSRFRAEAARLGDIEEAIVNTLGATGRAIVLSNLLLIGGFSVLMSSSFEPVRRVGILTMTTIGMALVSALLIIPVELKLLGRGALSKDKR